MRKKDIVNKYKVYSVSVPPYFANFIDEKNVSPTEVFRRGMVVYLFDLGIEIFLNDKNEKRSKFAEFFLKELDRIEKNMQYTETLIKLKDDLDKLNNEFKKLVYLVIENEKKD